MQDIAHRQRSGAAMRDQQRIGKGDRMQDNGSGGDASRILANLDSELGELVTPLKAKLAAAQERKTALLAEVAEIDTELRKAEKVLRILAPDEFEPRAKPGPKARGVSSTIRNYKISDSSLRRLADHLGEHYRDQPFSVSDVIKTFGMSGNPVTAGLETLRDASAVRLAGTVKRGPTNAKAYRVIPHGLDLWFEAANRSGVVV